MANLNVLGLMTGTSLDACDLCWCQIPHQVTKAVPKFVDYHQVPLPFTLRKKTWQLVQENQKMSAQEIAQLNYSWGTFFAKTVIEVIQKKKWQIDLVGLHGQTIAHIPGKISWQLGYPEMVSAQVKKPVVFNFRSSDTAAGYQGAPLAPIFHPHIVPPSDELIAVHNLGGISNTTLIWRGKIISAFDTGPGNIPIDTYVQLVTNGRSKFDKNGQWAKRGRPHLPLLNQLQKHPYFKKKGPKSTGREMFGGLWLQQVTRKYRTLSKYDMVATLTEWVAWHIGYTYRHLLPKIPSKIYFCGGGSFNQFLLTRIQHYLPQVEIQTTQALNWPPMAIESAAFAWLAYLRYKNIKINLLPITGNPKPQLLGQVYQ